MSFFVYIYLFTILNELNFLWFRGLWMGIICGLGTQVIALVTMILRTYWDEGVVDVSW